MSLKDYMSWDADKIKNSTERKHLSYAKNINGLEFCFIGTCSN